MLRLDPQVLLALWLPIVCCAAVLEAQDAPAARPEVPSAKALEDVLATIEDPERRARLVQDLKTLLQATKGEGAADAPRPGGLVGGLVGSFEGLSGQVKETFVQLLVQIRTIPGRWQGLRQDLSEPTIRGEFLFGLAAFLGILLAASAAAVAAWIALRPVSGKLSAVPSPAPGSVGGPARKLARLLGLALLDLGPPAALVAVTLAGLAVVGPPAPAVVVALAVTWAIALQKAASAALRALFSPAAPGLRLLPLSDGKARALASSLGKLSGLAVGGWFLLQALRGLGTGPVLLSPLRSLYGLALLAGGIGLVLRERGSVRAYLGSLSPPAATPPSAGESGAPISAAALAPDSTASPPGAFSFRSALVSVLGLWWLAAILYMVGLYMVWVSEIEGGFAFLLGATLQTTLAVAGAALLAALIGRLARRGQRVGERLGARYPELGPRLPQYLKGLSIVFYSSVIALAALLCLEAWGVSALEALGSQAAQTFLSSLIGILVVVVVAAAAIDVATVFAQRYLESRERSGKATGKVRTLVPLARKAIRVVVMAVAGIMILDQAGVEVAPLLAGVGVLGLAVGFGAQTLVKDIITGVFMLLEDTLAVGDVVKIDGAAGVVEAINIRTLRLRDGEGQVHTIPFSSVAVVTNMTRDFSRFVVEAGVAYDADVDKVCAVMREVGEELRQDPVLGKEVLQPIEVDGLERFDESAVVVRARMTLKPGQQWRVKREFHRRMKKAFDERKIEFPFPTRTIILARQDGVASTGSGGAGPSPPPHVRNGGNQG